MDKQKSAADSSFTEKRWFDLLFHYPSSYTVMDSVALGFEAPAVLHTENRGRIETGKGRVLFPLHSFGGFGTRSHFGPMLPHNKRRQLVSLYTQERFKRRTLHVPNLIIRFGTCKVRRMNQLGTALLYLGRLCRSFRLSLSNRTAKDRLRFIRRTSHVQNLMHKLC